MTTFPICLVYYGGLLLFVCACGAASERWLLKSTPKRGCENPEDQGDLDHG